MSISCNLYIEFIHIIYLNILIFLILFFFLIVLSFFKILYIFCLILKRATGCFVVRPITNFFLGRLANQIRGGGALTDHSYFCSIVPVPCSLWHSGVVRVCFSVVEYKSDASTWPAAERDRWRPALTTLWLGFTLFNGVYIFSFVSGLEEEAAVFCALR